MRKSSFGLRYPPALFVVRETGESVEAVQSVVSVQQTELTKRSMDLTE